MEFSYDSGRFQTGTLASYIFIVPGNRSVLCPYHDLWTKAPEWAPEWAANVLGPSGEVHCPHTFLLVPGHPLRASILGFMVRIILNSSDMTAQRRGTFQGLFSHLH